MDSAPLTNQLQGNGKQSSGILVAALVIAMPLLETNSKAMAKTFGVGSDLRRRCGFRSA